MYNTLIRYNLSSVVQPKHELSPPLGVLFQPQPGRDKRTFLAHHKSSNFNGHEIYDSMDGRLYLDNHISVDSNIIVNLGLSVSEMCVS